ncbi:hypothetical protein GWN63_02385, partial [Candidatus Bathyarchaeota archaeon]|nr:hypothetical protein [Candidatus Bathyarchaeota archaeon]NIU81081.1 hypothetical protein [Candidatus Bathyarchaeota archaeon]NIV67718.1 hypothetical protein [Candidatus Bathyarchaeota archaeon]
MFRTDPRSSVFTLIFLLTLSSYAPMASPTPGGLERTSDYADLTRTVSDVGIDLDDNGRFDYLQIGVQVVVHVAGQYLVNVHGLSPEEDGETWHPDIGVYNRKREYLTPGTHMVHVLLYGPKIHQSGLNPRKINRITLQWVDYTLFEPIMQLEGFIRDMPLSKPYNYTDFDAPSREGEATFTVYPNRSVAVSGALDHTHMIPSNPGPEVQGTADIARDGNLIRASADCTFIIPPDAASRLPFDLPINTTQISYQEEYSIPQFSSHLSVNTTLPPWLASQYPFNTTNLSMAGTYSEGLASVGMNLSTLLPQMITTMFPFNATDVTVTVQCTN